MRRAAVETLTRRKADDVLMAWIGLLRAPIKYEVRQVAGPGSPGVLFVEGEQFNFRRFYAPPSVAQTPACSSTGHRRTAACARPSLARRPPPGTAPPTGSQMRRERSVIPPCTSIDYTWAPPPPPPGPTKSYQQYEKSVLQAQIDRDFALDETAKMAEGAQAQLQHDVNVVEEANATIRERNARLSEALRRVAGQDLGEDREAWLKWWMKRKGYSYIPPEKSTQTNRQRASSHSLTFPKTGPTSSPRERQSPTQVLHALGPRQGAGAEARSSVSPPEPSF